MDVRENIEDLEEVIRACVNGMMKGWRFASAAQVTQDTTDGHVAQARPVIKREVTDPTTGQITYEDHPDYPDNPIHFAGGGRMVATHAVKQDDNGIQIFIDRCMDAWHQSGGTQQPMDDRIHSIADGIYIPGVRSDPTKLQQVDLEAHHIRSVDKKHVSEMHPDTGHHVKTVDPSTAPASASFDPFTQAVTYFEHVLHPTNGIAHNATSDGTTHSITNTHAAGPLLSALNGAHTVNAHPSNGVSIASTIAHLIQAPNASLDQGGNLTAQGSMSTPGAVSGASGSFSQGISLGAGGSGGTITSTNVGGDLSGTIDDAEVVGLSHANASTLGVYANDAAAKTGGVEKGGLYLNNTSVSGVTLLCVQPS